MSKLALICLKLGRDQAREVPWPKINEHLVGQVLAKHESFAVLQHEQTTIKTFIVKGKSRGLDHFLRRSPAEQLVA